MIIDLKQMFSFGREFINFEIILILQIEQRKPLGYSKKETILQLLQTSGEEFTITTKFQTQNSQTQSIT